MRIIFNLHQPSQEPLNVILALMLRLPNVKALSLKPQC